MVASIVNNIQTSIIVARRFEFLERLFTAFRVHPIMITI